MLQFMNDVLDGVTTELLGGVGIELTEQSKQMLSDMVAKLISEEDYFQSFDEGYTYINGNVAKKGHITVCMGIKNSDLKQKFEKSQLKINQSNCTIKEIQINLGYQGLYYIIVAIPEVGEDILAFNEWIRSNNDIHPGSPDFDPHISLCYIKNPGKYPGELYKEFQDKLIGKKLDFESIHFSKPYSEEKIKLNTF